MLGKLNNISNENEALHEADFLKINNQSAALNSDSFGSSDTFSKNSDESQLRSLLDTSVQKDCRYDGFNLKKNSLITMTKKKLKGNLLSRRNVPSSRLGERDKSFRENAKLQLFHQEYNKAEEGNLLSGRNDSSSSLGDMDDIFGENTKLHLFDQEFNEAEEGNLLSGKNIVSSKLGETNNFFELNTTFQLFHQEYNKVEDNKENQDTSKVLEDLQNMEEIRSLQVSHLTKYMNVNTVMTSDSQQILHETGKSKKMHQFTSSSNHAIHATGQAKAKISVINPNEFDAFFFNKEKSGEPVKDCSPNSVVNFNHFHTEEIQRVLFRSAMSPNNKSKEKDQGMDLIYNKLGVACSKDVKIKKAEQNKAKSVSSIEQLDLSGQEMKAFTESLTPKKTK